ncbi:MAG: hypothetical protein Q7U60_03865 [Candidatus Methanoperedens sp.]|nr:hypothetical protein [Candidatus Methanoperedens sp.]
MMSEKTKLLLVSVFAGLVLALFVPLQAIFLGLLLGLLFVPPVVALGSTLIEGISVISKELGKEQSERKALEIYT